MAHPSSHAAAQVAFDPAPSLAGASKVKLEAARSAPSSATCIGIPVATDEEVPRELGLDREALGGGGFAGKVGQVQVVPRNKGPTLIAFGIGPRDKLDATAARDAAAAFARAAAKHEKLALQLAETNGLAAERIAQAFVEGALLARYQYLLKRTSEVPAELRELTVFGTKGSNDEILRGISRAGITSRAAMLARDLAEAPATLLTARRLADIAQQLGASTGLAVEEFDEKQLLQMGCGGLLGVNAGSVEPPRMIKLMYKPKQPTGTVSLVAKGIMFDSGGLGLKPNDLVHATMKGDMSGAAAVLAAMSALQALGCTTAVTGYLMCTDNMPSGTAMKLGDVLTVRGGKTVEVINTDAEGRLVMADAIVLATEEQPRPDAIVDIATLTGACQRALGVLCAGVLGNHQGLVDQVSAAAERSDESVWQLPLEHRYRKELDSTLADLKNVGGDNAGAITAALFLEEFVDGIPWAHIDIAGTARVDADETWRPRGATGFGTRLLIDFLMQFSRPAIH